MTMVPLFYRYPLNGTFHFINTHPFYRYQYYGTRGGIPLLGVPGAIVMSSGIHMYQCTLHVKGSLKLIHIY